MIETGDTVRGTAKKYGISKSTVHKDITEKLIKQNRTLYLQVKTVLDKNKSERHLRGGEATRMKYEKMKSK
jgi:putative DeoR family transcriptional regulator (stage III sporulation protein D)